MSTELITTGVQKIIASYAMNEIIFEIDFDHPEAKKTIKEMAIYLYPSFDDETPFKDCLILWLQMASFYSHQFYCEEFGDLHKYFLNTEGFCAMDGSKGISIYSFNYFPYSYDDFEIKMY
ncbi:hypothetical protein J3U75_07470 [Snodgrassella sp. B3088]|uniref:hypothetical protein n=1 Tax=Snodgrassella sp. B3088 TaxID=2818038 RepID=UPI00226A0A55|nr:hypothetical protein [Snodgrassella sp. B3088]MCX8749220.1 hypothetical protein [Snodgrassella sp. B3088]